MKIYLKVLGMGVPRGEGLVRIEWTARIIIEGVPSASAEGKDPGLLMHDPHSSPYMPPVYRAFGLVSPGSKESARDSIACRVDEVTALSTAKAFRHDINRTRRNKKKGGGAVSPQEFQSSQNFSRAMQSLHIISP